MKDRFGVCALPVSHLPENAGSPKTRSGALTINPHLPHLL